MLNENHCQCLDRVCVLYIQKSFLQPTWSCTNQRRHSHLTHSDWSLFGGTCHLNDTIILLAKVKWPLLIVFFFAFEYSQPKTSPFLSAQQAREFFKVIKHLRALLLIFSSQCIMRNKHLPHFSPFYTNSFALLYEYKDKSLVRRMNRTFFLSPIEFSTIPGHFRG